MDFSDFDIEDLQKYFRRSQIDSQNRQAERQNMIDDTPPPNPYAGGGGEKKKGILGTIGSIAAPLMQIGGGVLSAAGMPYVGVPLSIAGGAVGGASSGGGGISGALGGAAKSGISQGVSYGMGAGLDYMKTPIDNPISVGEVGKTGGMTIPGRRMESIDLSSRNMTVPASPKSFGGGMS